MSKFDEYFSEVQEFSNGCQVLSGSFSKEEASAMFSEYTGESIGTSDISYDRVRFGFSPDSVEDLVGQACWYTGAGCGRGTKGIWIIG